MELLMIGLLLADSIKDEKYFKENELEVLFIIKFFLK